MIHEILPVGLLQCNCSIFGDETTREAVVIDPGDQIGDIQAILNKHGLKVKAIIVTHAHIDHIAGAAALKAATNAPVYLNDNDQVLYEGIDLQAAWLGMPPPEHTDVDVTPKDADTIVLNDTKMHVLHTPGHTQGSISLWIPSENKVIAGDTLFQGSIGRTDLPGGDGRQILRSIQSKLLTLPESAVVVPGHGPNTTIGEEKEFNPFLQGL